MIYLHFFLTLKKYFSFFFVGVYVFTLLFALFYCDVDHLGLK